MKDRTIRNVDKVNFCRRNRLLIMKINIVINIYQEPSIIDKGILSKAFIVCNNMLIMEQSVIEIIINNESCVDIKIERIINIAFLK